MFIKTTRLSTVRLVALSAALLAVPALLQAQAGPGVLRSGTVTDIRIAVWHPDDKDELASLNPGDTLILDVDEQVYIRLYAPRGSGPGDQRWYLSASFDVKGSSGHVRLTDADREKGSAILTATRATGGRDKIEVRYEMRGNVNARRSLARGSFTVEVEGNRPQGDDRPPSTGRVSEASQAMVTRLFNAILLRDPNDEAVEHFGRDMDRYGYSGLVDAAEEIASSEESRRTVYERGTDHEERLESLYAHLLDLDQDEVARDRWRDDLRQLERGQIDHVVLGMVRSSRFRSLYRNFR